MASPNVEATAAALRLQEFARNLIAILRDEVISQRGNGVPDNQILQNVVNQQQGNTGRLAGVIRGQAKDVTRAARFVYTSTQAELSAGLANKQPSKVVIPRGQGYTVTIDDQGRRITRPDPSDRIAPSERELQQHARKRAETKMVWVTVFANSCKDCIALAGQVKTLQQWKESGYWPGNGRTVCGENCKCHLTTVDSMADTLRIGGSETEKQAAIQKELANGIKLQQKKIEELERIRGEKFAKSTYLQKLGQIRNENFNPNHLKTESVFRKTTNQKEVTKFRDQQVEKILDKSGI